MAHNVDEELASERAKVNALQYEIARLKREQQGSPSRALRLPHGNPLWSFSLCLHSIGLEPGNRGASITPGSQPSRVRAAAYENNPLSMSTPGRTSLSVGVGATLPPPPTLLTSSAQTHSNPPSRRETPPPRRPPPTTASAEGSPRPSGQWSGPRPNIGSPRPSNNNNMPPMRMSSGGRMQSASAPNNESRGSAPEGRSSVGVRGAPPLVSNNSARRTPPRDHFIGQTFATDNSQVHPTPVDQGQSPLRVNRAHSSNSSSARSSGTLIQPNSTPPSAVTNPFSTSSMSRSTPVHPSSGGGFSAASLLADKNKTGVGESSPLIMPSLNAKPSVEQLNLDPELPPSTPPPPPSDQLTYAALDAIHAAPRRSGFSASSLLGSFIGDDAEMLRSPPKSIVPATGWALQPPSDSMMADDDGGMINTAPSLARATGFLPSSTPAAIEGGSAVEKVLDRVEDDLVFFSKNFQIILKGGTIAKVIERLTAESQADNSVVDTFLLTYRKFILPENLLEKLFERYNLKPPQPFSTMDAHSIALHEHSLKIVRLRVGNFIKRWLSEHFQDFRGNETLIDRLAVMCKQTFLQNERTLGEKILNTLEEQRQKLDARRRGGVARGERPDSIMPKTSNYDDFDPLEMARQLCLYEQQLFRQIHPKECLDQCWSKSDRYERAPNLMKLIDLFNCFANWIATQVLKHAKLEDRVREIKKFVRMAIELRKLNNFNGCQEVLAGLSDSSIFRLSATWIKVQKDRKLYDEYQEVKRALSPDRSWVNYRALLKEIQPPCIPYVGVYLTDLTFIEDGNSNYLLTEDGRSDIINFEKCRKQAVVIGNILLYQQDQYNFDRVDAIYTFFESGLVFNNDKDALFKLSRSVEPPDMVEEAKKKVVRKAEKDRKKNEKKAKESPAPPRQASNSVMYPSQASMASRR